MNASKAPQPCPLLLRKPPGLNFGLLKGLGKAYLALDVRYNLFISQCLRRLISQGSAFPQAAGLARKALSDTEFFQGLRVVPLGVEHRPDSLIDAMVDRIPAPGKSNNVKLDISEVSVII